MPVARASPSLPRHAKKLSNPQAKDLSEQFLYWVIKDHHDGQPNSEGTKMRYAGDALLQDGICTEVLCPYSAEHISSGRVSRWSSTVTRGRSLTPVDEQLHPYTMKAAQLLPSTPALLRGTPVALSLPVFASASNANRHNWNTSIALERGVVLTPPSDGCNRRRTRDLRDRLCARSSRAKRRLLRHSQQLGCVMGFVGHYHRCTQSRSRLWLRVCYVR